MNQVRMNNPQVYQQISQLKNSGANPQNLIQQMVNQSNTQQMQYVLNQAKMFGVPDNVLTQIQNMKKG